ncbi:MAG: hypothetical protein AAF587_09685 [Bacteroidota bacterium]
MEKIKLELTIDEANVILEALGSMPFVKVYELIGKIQSQASEQLNPEASGAVSISPPKE